MIRVCDAIMGQGKTTSSIAYMNEHPNDRFIYITPYLEEAERIKESCPELNFVEPSSVWSHGYSKVNHTQELIHNGLNVATTHQAFKMYTPEMLEDIRDKGYSLIIDENVELLERCDIHEEDLNILVEAGYVSEDNEVYTLVRQSYDGIAFRDLIRLMRSRQITKVGKSGRDGSLSDEYFFWILSPELVTSFKDVFILTYLFEGQSIHHFLEMYEIPYDMVGIERIETDNGYTYRFGNESPYIPEYVSHLNDMIEILDNKKLNSLGEDETALSKVWFTRNGRGVAQLKRNLHNLFQCIWTDSELDERMWATFKSEKGKLQGKGYTSAYTVLNQRATNKLRDRLYLAYVCNLYMNVSEKIFFQRNGITIDEDAYALSIMVQWIWRSAIRDGEKIYLYLPSKRMRRILTDWINKLTSGGDNP